MQEFDKEKLLLATSKIAEQILQFEAKTNSSITPKELWQIKLDACREYGLSTVPKNSEILERFDPLVRGRYFERLRRKSIRTRSGIAVVTVITKPFACPHGTCTFCPGGVRFGTPQSYTKNSPANSFGELRGYDAKMQVRDMLDILERNGHDTSKIELILLGGTILAMPLEYQTEFVKQSYDALNSQGDSQNLADAIKNNETAHHRCVGLTIETKPDWCKESHIDLLLSYGTTRVEIGVQSLREEVLKFVNRGHSLQDTIDSFRRAKDSSFKLVAHMMPGLPNSNVDRDLEDLIQLVSDESFKPDMLKIYPALVVEGTALYNQYKMGLFQPYSVEELVELLSKFKKLVPRWVRIMRIQREIPKVEIAKGPSAGNLRQLVLDEMKRRGERCSCIRCRESGHSERQLEDFSDIALNRIDYEASAGHEVFLSFDDSKTDTLLGFLRLRIPSGLEHRPEIKGSSASLVRELHVYGPVVPVGFKSSDPEHPQHHGLGTRLLHEAERVSRVEFSKKKIIVISAVGTREYYRNRGYRDDGPYVSKAL